MSEIDIKGLMAQCAEYLGQGMFPPAFANSSPERATRQLLLDRFLELIGWSREPTRHAKQVDEFGVAEVGSKWTDYALMLDSRPYIFVEAKSLWDSKLEKHSKQLIQDLKKFNRENPARRTVYWGVLTNFREVQVYYYDDTKPFLRLGYEDYEEQWEILEKLLSPAGIDHQELEKFYRENSKRPLDDEFLEDLKKWRLIIANGLYRLNSKLTISELKRASQRLLDRLILIRILETSGVLPYEWLALRFRSWREGIIGLNKTFGEVLQETFKEFESLYDTELFHHNHTDTHEIDDGFLRELIKVTGLPSIEVSKAVDESQQSFDDKGLYGYNFNLLTVDIMGSVYERYLAHSITTHDGRVVIERQEELRKKEGIYYTPPFVVNHIIENELASLVTPVLTDSLAILEQGEARSWTCS